LIFYFIAFSRILSTICSAVCQLSANHISTSMIEITPIVVYITIIFFQLYYNYKTWQCIVMRLYDMKFLLNNQMGKSVQKINILVYRYNLYDVRYDFLWKNIKLQYNFLLYCCFFKHWNCVFMNVGNRLKTKKHTTDNSTYLNQGKSKRRKKLDIKCLKIIYLFSN